MVNGKFRLTYLFDQTTHQRIKGYLQNIAMTPIKFRFKSSLRKLLGNHDLISTDVMTYKILLIRKYSATTDEAILVNKNLI